MPDVFFADTDAKKLAVASFALQILGYPPPVQDAKMFGIVVGEKIVASVIFHDLMNVNGKPHSIAITMATDNPRWCTRKVMNQFSEYIFGELGIKVFWGQCAKRNKKMRKLFERLGFRFEGVARGRYPDGSDATVYSIKKEEINGFNT